MIELNTFPPELPQITEVAAKKEDKTAPFRIKELAKNIFIALAATFAAMGLVGGILCAFVELAPIGLPLLITAAVGFVLLNTVLFFEAKTPDLPDSVRPLGERIQSTIREFFTDLSKVPLFFIDLTKWDPKTKEEIDPNQTPVLFIHGFLGSSSTWVYHRSRLDNAGYKNLFTINLGSPSHSIEEYGLMVDEKVKEIKRLTGRDDIRLICHSMGGLVAREWLYNHSKTTGVKPKGIITIGSPLNGTDKARYTCGLFPCALEMYPESDFVKKQQEQAALDNETNYYHIGSKTDSIVQPVISAYEGGVPLHKLKTDTLDATDHGSLLLSDTTADLILKYLHDQDALHLVDGVDAENVEALL